MFQECKKEIFVRYCTIKSSSEMALDIKIGQVWSDVYIEYVYFLFFSYITQLYSMCSTYGACKANNALVFAVLSISIMSK